MLGAGAAGAHVSVKPSSAPQGGFEILSFSVPNEKDDANTVELVVELPTKYPIAVRERAADAGLDDHARRRRRWRSR